MASTSSHGISKASIRRLAHDVDQRLGKNSYDDIIPHVELFVSRILSLCYRVASFARRKAISIDHIAYAVKALKVHLPPELQQAKLDDFKRLQKCNIRAPAQQRKQNALHAEISEASFNRIIKKNNVFDKQPCRLTVSAKHFLQLIVEQYIMSLFRNSPGQDDSFCDVSGTIFSDTYGCSAERGQVVAHLVTNLINQIPTLLSLNKSHTVDERLLLLAFSVTSEKDFELKQNITPQFIRHASHILRGRLINSRVTTGACRTLASIIQSCIHDEL